MRVVFDANIFVSALVFPGSQAEKALLRVIEGIDDLVISREIIKEVLRVLSSKFSRDAEALSRVAVNLSDIGEVTEVKGRLAVLKDDPDNRVLECAVSGSADLIVTGDKEMLRIRQYEGIQLVTLKKYLDARTEDFGA